MAIPKLALIPSGVKAGKLYSVLPTNGDGDFTTTRASVATRVNENGLIEEVAANVPRLDYSDGGCPSLLLEPTSTNLITYSEDFSNAYWTKDASSVTSGFTSPKGDLSAFKLVEDSANSNHSVYVSSGALASNVYAFSTFIKKGERYKCAIADRNSGAYASFNLNDGTIIEQSGMTGKIELISNDWYKISIASTSNITLFITQIFVLEDSYTTGVPILLNYTGDGTSGVYIWGAQMEENSYATSYIKNAGTALGVTRVADTATGSGNSTVINSSEGVLYAEISALANDLTSRYIVISDGTVSNFVSILFFPVSNSIRYSVTVGGVEVSDLIYALSDITELNKFAVSWKLNEFKLYVNGVKRGEDLLGNIYSPQVLNTVDFQHPQGGNFYGKTKSVQVYTTALSDAELTTLTTI